jgi:hypothetical protein
VRHTLSPAERDERKRRNLLEQQLAFHESRVRTLRAELVESGAQS